MKNLVGGDVCMFLNLPCQCWVRFVCLGACKYCLAVIIIEDKEVALFDCVNDL